MTNTPRVTVVVPYYNDAPTIGPCIEALLRQTLRASMEVIVVDDGSTDDGPTQIARFPVNLVSKPNGGPASARNAGAAHAHGEFIIFLDADCIASPDWAESLLSAFSDREVVAVMGAIRSTSSESLPRLVQLEIEERYQRLGRTRYVDFFASAVVAFRRRFFLDIGGFRADLRYNEDVELAYRIHRSGAKIVFHAAQPVAHLHQNTWRSYFWTKFWRGVWRMRVYRLYPRQALSDSWTPQSLKIQIVLAALLPLVLLAVALRGDGYWVAAVLLGASLWSARSFLGTAWRAGGAALAGRALPFLWVRAWALGSAVVWNMLMPWRPAMFNVTEDKKT
jgi:glycosyltransferase involved in cell wall biosynthesis